MRNKKVDMFRSIALIMVMVYHIWVMNGQSHISVDIMETLVKLGGEIGVTAFFLLSGFGIYNAISKMDSKGELNWGKFIKKRFIRIAPEYYLSLAICILFTSSAVYLSLGGMKDIITHILFIHNLFVETQGSISGVLWTMGVIVQFYIIAIPLYHIVKKNNLLAAVISVILTVVIKFILFHIIGPMLNITYNFYLSRSLFCSDIDNFVLGMCVADVLTKHEFKLRNKSNIRIASIILIILTSIILYLTCKTGLMYGIHTDNLSGYTWHSIVAILLAVIIGLIALPIYTEKEYLIGKGLLWISKYEYGIYVIHLLIIQNLLQNSSLVQMIAQKSNFILSIVLITADIGCGVIYSFICDNLRKRYIKNNSTC